MGSEMSEEDKTAGDDMFADISTDSSNVTELDAIIQKAIYQLQLL